MCSAAGSSTQEDVDPQERKGALWDTYRRLVEEGWTPDVHSYTTSFRSASSQTFPNLPQSNRCNCQTTCEEGWTPSSLSRHHQLQTKTDLQTPTVSLSQLWLPLWEGCVAEQLSHHR